MTRKRIYVAGPYTKGDPCINTHAAIAAGNRLLDAGFAPFVPHLSHFWHTVTPRPYADWLALDLPWVAASDAVLRLSGESKGADLEVAHARENGVPVFEDMAALLAHFAGQEAS